MDIAEMIKNSQYFKDFSSRLVGAPEEKERIKNKVLKILAKEFIIHTFSKLDEETLTKLDKSFTDGSNIENSLKELLTKLENYKVEEVFKEFEEGKMKELINKFSN